ncbi:MAG: response regulator [Candidatus Omnitrophica bacterium]|nr:response regulator [Candidatus Omnitrophota bacterium]MCM8794060.1 response regulator [Candidatus Omnitrophota bacterium]
MEKKRILIVDDEKNMCEALFDVLEQEGFSVSTALDKEEALRLAKNIEFDLLLLDVRLKGTQGTELISAFKEIRPEMAVIIITGYPSLDSAIEGARLGISDYLLKPISMESLKASIQNALIRKEKEEQREQLVKKLEEAGRRISQLEATLGQATKLASLGKIGPAMFHEVKNILSIINVSAYYLKKNIEAKDPKVKKHLEIVEKEIEHAHQIIMGLLDLSRGLPEKLVPCDINQLIEETISLLNHELELKGIKIVKDYGSEIPLLFLEPNELKQVFINIMLNAQDAMSRGGELRIVTEKENGFLSLRFSDTGCGIKRADLEKIFTPFFTTKKESGGMGLGLVVSQEIVKKYGGIISVESEENKGSTFTIRLPLGKAVEILKEKKGKEG